MTDNKLRIILYVFSAAILLFAGWALHPCPLKPASQTIIKVVQREPEKRDSIGASYSPMPEKVGEKQHAAIRKLIAKGVKIDTTKTTDSTVTVQPFVAKSDTVTFTDGSKIQADYTFLSSDPFRFYYKPKPDTTKEVRIIIEPSWYEKPLFVSGATATVLTAVYLIFNRR